MSHSSDIRDLQDQIGQAIKSRGLETEITAVILDLTPEKARKGMDAVQSFFVRNEGLEIPLSDLYEAVWIAVYTEMTEEEILDAVKDAIALAKHSLTEGAKDE